MQENARSSKCRILKVGSSFPRERLTETRNEVIRSYTKERKVSKDLANDINARSFIRNRPTHARMDNRH